MNEIQFGNRIRQILNNAPALPADKSARLAEARAQALQRQRPELSPALAWADNVLGLMGGWTGLSLRVMAPAVALVVSLAAIYTWQQKQRVAEVEEIDAMLLTDELPIDAYLDRGFQNWLKKRLSEE
ncbi:MAG TPA: DUF3619 family protein [Burkholderiales bacterium]|nr:DUF3619 family protein [Burkholderiales bacterium]